MLPTESETQGSYLVEAGHTPIIPDDFCSVSDVGVIDLAAREVSPSNKLAENREIPTTKKRKQKKKKKKVKRESSPLIKDVSTTISTTENDIKLERGAPDDVDQYAQGK